LPEIRYERSEEGRRRTKLDEIVKNRITQNGYIDEIRDSEEKMTETPEKSDLPKTATSDVPKMGKSLTSNTNPKNNYIYPRARAKTNPCMTKRQGRTSTKYQQKLMG
jgi:hypothetical protein